MIFSTNNELCDLCLMNKNSKCSDSNILAGYSNAKHYLKFINAMETNWVTTSYNSTYTMKHEDSIV